MLRVKIKNPPKRETHSLRASFFRSPPFTRILLFWLSYHSFLPGFTLSGLPDKICGFRNLNLLELYITQWGGFGNGWKNYLMLLNQREADQKIVCICQLLLMNARTVPKSRLCPPLEMGSRRPQRTLFLYALLCLWKNCCQVWYSNRKGTEGMGSPSKDPWMHRFLGKIYWGIRK